MNSSKEILDLSEAKTPKAFLRFSEQTVGSEMYQYLSKQIAADPELIALAEKGNPSQPIPNLFLAAVNYLLYKNPSEELCAFYPNHSGRKFQQEGFYLKFRSFCLNRSEEIADLIRHRLVQTNEVRRCALLLPAVMQVTKSVGSEIALIDVGTSSGLNLLLDLYYYKYSDGQTVGNPKSQLQIECKVEGEKLPLSRMPQIKQRIGIDLNPVDLNNQDEVLWTLSLVWPDQVERIERLKAAINILSQNPVDLVRGDATLALRSVVSNISKELTICLMHSFTLNQFSIEDRSKFDKLLCDLSSDRDIWRISLEWLGTQTPELTLEHYKGRAKSQRLALASCHQHGEWIRFF